MGSCSLFAVTNLAGFGDSQNFLNNKVGMANSEWDPNYLQYISVKKSLFFFNIGLNSNQIAF